jgi:hypothetical protein
VHALHLGEGMARGESALLVAKLQGKEPEAIASDNCLTRWAPAQRSSRMCRMDVRQPAGMLLIYAFAARASGRAVFDSQFLRNSSRFLSTKALASSKLA